MMNKAFLALMLFGIIVLPSCKSSQKLDRGVKDEVLIGNQNESFDVLKFTLEYSDSYDIVDSRNLTFTRKYRPGPTRRKFSDLFKKKKDFYSYGTIMIPSVSVPIQFTKEETDAINSYYYSAKLDTLPDNVTLQILSDNYVMSVYLNGRTQRFSGSNSANSGQINADVNKNVKRLLEYIIVSVSQKRSVKSLRKNEIIKI